MKKAQALLEFSLIFIVMVILIGGLLKLWSWSNSNIWGVQGAFESTRVQAGSHGSAGEPSSFGVGKVEDSETFVSF